MKFNRIDNENLETTLEIIIEPQDYISEYKKQIRDIQNKGSFKGFRKGKTPESFVAKMYGKSILADIVSKEVDKAFDDIVKKEDLNYVAQPLPSDQSDLAFDYKDLNKPYSYKLDLGLVGDIVVKGLEDSYTLYDVNVDEAELEDHLKNISNTFGAMEEVDDMIQKDDILKVSATELDGLVPKKDGWMASFDIVMKSISSEDLKNELIDSKKKGDSFVASIKDVTNRPEGTLRKSLLGVEDGDDREIGDVFSFKIEAVERLKPAELTDELIKEKLATWNLNSIEELKEDFKKNRSSALKNDANAMLNREVMDNLMEKSEVQLSTSFIERWLKESEKMDEKKLDENLDSITKEMKWVKLKGHLIKQYNVEIDESDFEAKLNNRARQILSQYGIVGDDTLLPEVKKRLLEDKNEYYNLLSTVESEKLFEAIRPSLNIEEKKIKASAFNDIIEEKFGNN